MPWHVAKSSQCPSDHPFAVIKTDTGEKVACHMTKEGAQSQVDLLYAKTSDAERAQLAAATINDLPDSAFAYIEPGGKKDDQGKTVPRSKRHFPIHDAAHVRAALARAPQSPFGDKAMPKIRAAAKKFGIEVADSASRAEVISGPVDYARLWALDDVVIRSGGAGRDIEAYATVFGVPAEIHDQHGHYMEVIDRNAFNRQLGLGIDHVGVYFNHGLTIHGTPSDLGSVPIGHPLSIKPDKRGLLTVSRLNRSDLADAALEAIRNNDVRGFSFRGRIYKSNPSRVPSRRGGGPLPTVTRTELGLTEYGPTQLPAYEDARVLAIRALQALTSTTLAGDDRWDEEASPAAPDVGLGAEDQPDDGHSGRLHQRHLALRRAMRERGIFKE